MATMIVQAREIRPGDYVMRWRDTVASVKANHQAQTITLTMTHEGERHTMGYFEALTIEW